MASVKEGSFVNVRKQTIFTTSWVPAGKLRGVFFWHIGIGEYITKYSDVFTQMAEQSGFAIYSHDYHGHGRSDPKEEKLRAYMETFDDILDDSRQFMDSVLPQHPGLPVIVGGCSLGGLTSTQMVLRRPNDFAGLMLISAGIDVEWTPVLRVQAALGQCLACMFPYAKLVPAVRAEDLFANQKDIDEQYWNDAMIYKGNTKANTGYQILKVFKATGNPETQKKITVPIYAMHGTKDKCTSIKAVKTLVANASSTDKTFNEVEGAYHVILSAPEGPAAIASMCAWLTVHGKDAAAAAAVPAADAAPAAADAAVPATAAAVPAADAAPAAAAAAAAAEAAPDGVAGEVAK